MRAAVLNGVRLAIVAHVMHLAVTESPSAIRRCRPAAFVRASTARDNGAIHPAAGADNPPARWVLSA